MTFPGLLLWGVLPYVAIVALVGGTIWRRRYDRFGWTTRSSENLGRRVLAIASPLFHYGVVGVFFGHVLGLLIPQEWTSAIGVDEHAYHLIATWLGLVAAAATVVGLGMLIVRRRVNTAVFRATTSNDKLMYVFLAGAICLGTYATIWNAVDGPYNYRDTVSLWFKSLFYLQPKVSLMSATPIAYRIHAVVGLLLIGMWPFTRLVHAFAAPVQYLFRPYVVYRSRDPRRLGSREPARGWGRIDT